MSKVVTKRAALRFPGFNRFLRYRTEYDDGEGQLLNISTHGCAIVEMTIELAEQEKTLLILELDNPNDPLEIRALVTRVDGGSAGLQFQHLDDDAQHRIRTFFAAEKRRHLGKEAVTT